MAPMQPMPQYKPAPMQPMPPMQNMPQQNFKAMPPMKPMAPMQPMPQYNPAPMKPMPPVDSSNQNSAHNMPYPTRYSYVKNSVQPYRQQPFLRVVRQKPINSYYFPFSPRG